MLRELICDAEVVSFDIFDTLLCRRVLRPTDVFRLMDEAINAKLLEGTPSVEENVVISYFAAEAFNSPFGNFHENGKLIINDCKLLSKLMVAPLLTKYIIWLAKHLKANGNEDLEYIIKLPNLGNISARISKRFEICPDVSIMNADITVYDELLGFFDRDYMDIDASILGKVINYDELLGYTVTELNR